MTPFLSESHSSRMSSIVLPLKVFIPLSILLLTVPENKSMSYLRSTKPFPSLSSMLNALLMFYSLNRSSPEAPAKNSV